MRKKIIQNVPRGFLQDLLDGIHDVFLSVEKVVKDGLKCEEPEYLQVRGHLRQSELQRTLRNVAEQHGLRALAAHTSPKGGRYSIVYSGDLILVLARVDSHAKCKRPNKYLTSLAQVNMYLDPVQLNFFKNPELFPSDKTAVLVLTASPKPGQDQTIPAYVGLGIPSADFSTWHFMDSMEAILSVYPNSKVAGIQDKAHPKLKKGLRKGGDGTST